MTNTDAKIMREAGMTRDGSSLACYSNRRHDARDFGVVAGPQSLSGRMVDQTRTFHHD